MAKKITKKEPISLRAKTLKGGRVSLYLDYYQPGCKNHAHRYEFLKLYLLPDTKENKEVNKVTLESAKVILRQRLIQLAQGKADIVSGTGNKITLTDYFAAFIARKKNNGASPNTVRTYNNVLIRLKDYGHSTMLSNITKEYILDFFRSLSNSQSRVSKEAQLTQNSAYYYSKVLRAVINQAEKDGFITINPLRRISQDDVKFLKPKQSQVVYLTKEELNILVNTSMRNEQSKCAFLFACFTGLRFSDIVSLKWIHIIKDDNGMRIDKNMVKTLDNVTIPLSEQALAFLPQKGKDDNVFRLPMYSSVNSSLKRWAERAGIEKNIHFHVSRHTFATLLLTQGADLYTVSKLLGHKDIKVTQVYAEIVNKKKIEATDLLNGILS